MWLFKFLLTPDKPPTWKQIAQEAFVALIVILMASGFKLDIERFSNLMSGIIQMETTLILTLPALILSVYTLLKSEESKKEIRNYLYRIWIFILFITLIYCCEFFEAALLIPITNEIMETLANLLMMTRLIAFAMSILTYFQILYATLNLILGGDK